MQATPVYRDLVLVGGGHSHVAVLKRFGMQPLPGVRLTLISPTTLAPYSGMLPGLVAGVYTEAEAHIDLEPLCRFANARLIRGRVIGLEPERQRVRIAGRPPIRYDRLSINTGSTPTLPAMLGDTTQLIPVKPVDRFLEAWQQIRAAARESSTPLRLAIVGSGAGGVELALAVAARLQDDAALVEILTADDRIVATHNPAVRRYLEAVLDTRAVTVHYQAPVVAVDGGSVTTASGTTLDYDAILWATEASAPAWLGESGLAVDARGFLVLDRYLRSVSDPNVFGAGDAGTITGAPRPKAGVFAVRQGPPLADNLRRSLLGRRLVAHRPQRAFLSLIGTGDGAAVASRGRFAWSGRRVWQLKEWIDRRFMRRFQALPAMTERPSAPVPPAISAGAAIDLDAMRCGGCGAKVGADVLDAALSALRRKGPGNETSSAASAGDGGVAMRRSDIVGGLGAPDDAALLTIPPGRLVAISVDAFRPMLDDPYLFGQITANHCLNDLYAIGAVPQSALAIAALPNWPEAKLVDELYQMLAGATAMLAEAGAELVGGHTSEGAEISLGFSVTGLAERDRVLTKTGLRAGDRLVLTKPLGTGVILAARMRGLASGVAVDAAIAAMCRSNQAAAQILAVHGAHACTDVTGFGLLGHLHEMAGPEGARVGLDADALPLLAGAAACVELGIASTMQPNNVRLAERMSIAAALAAHPLFEIVFDPQTAGGLLAALPADAAVNCATELVDAGYDGTAIIGHVIATGTGGGVSLELP